METFPSKGTEAEAKLVKEVIGVVTEANDTLQQLLEKVSFWKSVRITAWIVRFIHNCQHRKSDHIAGSLTTKETKKQIQIWINRAQASYAETERFKEDVLQVNLHASEDGLSWMRS